MTPKPKKPPDPSQTHLPCPSLFLPYSFLCPLGRLSSVPSCKIGPASFDGKMAIWDAPFKLRSRFAIEFRLRFRSRRFPAVSISMAAIVVKDLETQLHGILQGEDDAAELDLEEECFAASVAKDLGIQREGPLPDEADVDPSNRFAIVFNLGGFQSTATAPPWIQPETMVSNLMEVHTPTSSFFHQKPGKQFPFSFCKKFKLLFALLLGICHLLFGLSMLSPTMYSFTVFLVLCLVRFVCSWLQQFLGDSVGLQSMVDSCWVCGTVIIRGHYNFDYVTVVFHIILLFPVIVFCDLVLIVLFLVIFGNEVWGQRQFCWSLDLLVSVYPLLPMGVGGASSLDLWQLHPYMAPFMVHDVHFLCVSLSRIIICRHCVCRSSWHFAVCFSSYVSILVDVKFLGGFLQPLFLILSWHFVSILWSVMVSGCKGRPLWSNASPLAQLLEWNMSLAVITKQQLWISVPGFVEHWQPKLKLFLSMTCNALVWVDCWPMFIASTFLPCWFLSYCPCWVWKSVVQLGCLLFSSPGSDCGFFPLVCCWKDVHSVGLWPFLWLSVTSSCKLGQPKLKVLLTLACDALDCAVYCSEAIACTSPFLLSPCWIQISCSYVVPYCKCTGVLLKHFLHHDWVQAHYGAIKPFWKYFDLYWIDEYYCLYLYSIVVSHLVQSLTYVVPYCKCWFTRIVLQYGSVFRLCHQALAQHRRMLRLALRGFDITS